MDDRAQAVVDRLELGPHPEGGYFREIYRSSRFVQPLDERSRRAAVTTIYYMLAAGQYSRWHRVQSDEIWHFYEGEPMDLFVAPPEFDRVERIRLGPPDGYVFTVPANWWQAATPTGAYSLAGCTVAPGFEYTDFTLLADDPGRERLAGRLDSAMRALV